MAQDTRSSKLLSNSAGALAQCLTLLLLMPYLASRLGPVQFSVFAGLSALAVLVLLFETGLSAVGAAVSRHAISRTGGLALRRQLGETVKLGRLRFILAIGAALSLTPFIDGFFALCGDPVAVSIIGIALVGGSLQILAAPYVGALLGIGRGDQLGGALALSAALQALLVVWVVERTGDLTLVFCALALGSLIQAGLLRAPFLNLPDVPLDAVTDLPDARSMARTRTRQGILTNGAQLALGHVDVLVVLFLFSPAATMFYVLGQALAVAARLLVNVVEPTALVFVHGVSSSSSASVGAFLASVRSRILVACAVLVPCAALAPHIVRVWLPHATSGEVALTAGVAAVLALGYAFGSPFARCAMSMKHQGRESWGGRVAAVEVLVAGMLGGLFVGLDLGPGPLGIASGFGGARAVFGLIVAPFWAGREVGATAVEVGRACLLPALVPAGVSAIVLVGIRAVLPAGATWLIPAFLVGVAAFAAGAWWLVLDAEERRQVRERLRQVFVITGTMP